jgi:cell wall-associated NlpC family hydrolase
MIAEQEWAVVVNRLVGKPFKWSGRGPDAFDCWGLVIEARRSLGLPVGIDWETWVAEGETPRIESSEMMEVQTRSPTWEVTHTPEPGDIVALSSRHAIHHVGVLTPFGILNSVRGLGATLASPARLKTMGYTRIEYFKWVG